MTHYLPAARSVLAIDDDPMTLKFLELLLATSGYDVRTASTGGEGLELAAQRDFHAILLDRRLPDIDGLAVCAMLRSDVAVTIPIIILTADHDPHLPGIAQDAGATMVIQKPFEPKTLIDNLAQLS